MALGLGRLARRCLDAVLAPAADPRAMAAGDASAAPPAGLERQQALLAQVRGALRATEQARERLASRRAALVTLGQSAAVHNHLAEVERAEAKLASLAERLGSQTHALEARQEVLSARLSAAAAQARASEALGDLAQELEEIGLAAAHAERVTEELEARLQAMDDVESATGAP